MKKVLLSLIFGGLLAGSVSAAPILISVGFGNQLNTGISSNAAFTNIPPIAGGETAVWFTSTTFNNTACSGAQSVLCGSATVTTGTSLLNSGGAASVFTWASGLTYTTTSAWTISADNSVPKGFKIATTGTYTGAGFDPTEGNLVFSFQEPAITSGGTTFYTFSASGTTVPEPGSLALLGSGLLGLGYIARRRAAR